MDRFLALPESDRRAVFLQTAARMGRIDPSAVEKDFWICLFLKRIFESPLRERLVFKGGTSHYYDAVMLARSPTVRSDAFGNPQLPEDVIAFSDRFFRQSWTHEHPPRPGAIRLVPPPRVEAALRDDYGSMQEMIWGEAPAFEDLLAELHRLETDINARK